MDPVKHFFSFSFLVVYCQNRLSLTSKPLLLFFVIIFFIRSWFRFLLLGSLFPIHATHSNWNFSIQPSDSEFEFKPPAGVTQVDFADRGTAPAAPPK